MNLKRSVYLFRKLTDVTLYVVSVLLYFYAWQIDLWAVGMWGWETVFLLWEVHLLIMWTQDMNHFVLWKVILAVKPGFHHSEEFHFVNFHAFCSLLSNKEFVNQLHPEASKAYYWLFLLKLPSRFWTLISVSFQSAQTTLSYDEGFFFESAKNTREQNLACVIVVG